MTTDAQPPAGEPIPQLAPRPKVIEEANETLKAPWAAGVAGLLFAALFTSAVFLVRSSPTVGATTEQLRVIYATGQDQPALIAGLYLMPFAGIMFLWFIAVIRDQIGEHEDRFFATVFLGSGLIFVSVLFVASAIATSPSVSVRYLDQSPPSSRETDVVRAFTYALMFGYATRAAAVFLLTMSTLGMRSRAFPLWLARAGYLVAIVLLLVVAFFDWIILVFPAWIALVSLYVIRRERGRRLAGSSAPVTDAPVIDAPV